MGDKSHFVSFTGKDDYERVLDWKCRSGVDYSYVEWPLKRKQQYQHWEGGDFSVDSPKDCCPLGEVVKSR